MCDNVTNLFSPQTGICYSFNFVGSDEDKDITEAYFTGAAYGFALEIDIEGVCF